MIVSAGLLEAMADQALAPDQAAAVMAHAAVLVRRGWVRHDVLITGWALPWQLLRAVAETAAAAGRRRLPLTALAWRLRFVVGTVAVVQLLQQGQPGLGAFTAAVIAGSYAIPVAERAWQARMVAAGDEGLAAAGLAPAMAAFLRRCPPTVPIRARIRVLDAATGAASSADRLALVH